MSRPPRCADCNHECHGTPKGGAACNLTDYDNGYPTICECLECACPACCSARLVRLARAVREALSKPKGATLP